jgi:hypothetical protein
MDSDRFLINPTMLPPHPVVVVVVDVVDVVDVVVVVCYCCCCGVQGECAIL